MMLKMLLKKSPSSGRRKEKLNLNLGEGFPCGHGISNLCVRSQKPQTF